MQCRACVNTMGGGLSNVARVDSLMIATPSKSNSFNSHKTSASPSPTCFCRALPLTRIAACTSICYMRSALTRVEVASHYCMHACVSLVLCCNTCGPKHRLTSLPSCVSSQGGPHIESTLIEIGVDAVVTLLLHGRRGRVCGGRHVADACGPGGGRSCCWCRCRSDNNTAICCLMLGPQRVPRRCPLLPRVWRVQVRPAASSS
jgi:hypothetical protein